MRYVSIETYPGHGSSVHESDGLGLVDSSTTSVSEMPLDESPTSSVGLVSPPISPEDDASHGAIKAKRPPEPTNSLITDNALPTSKRTS